MFVTPQLVALVVFVVYVFGEDRRLDIVTLFEVLAFINALRTPSMLFAQALSSIGEAAVAIRRIESFLLATAGTTALRYGERFKDGHCPHDMGQNIVSMSKASFSWDIRAAGDAADEGETFRLHDVDVSIKKSELVAVIGVVGSGKTSLMHAILSEMPILSGTSALQGQVAFAAQTPWIQNMTLRSNVLFGKHFDRAQYREVLAAACLESDCQLLPSRDLTEIGERGINLSGGQKSRVAFARVLYSCRECDLILLDDPFSAVDGSTGEQMFQLGVSNEGVLKGKTRIVALNSHLNLLPQFDRVLIMENGCIVADGPPSDLRESLSRFVLDADDRDRSAIRESPQNATEPHDERSSRPKSSSSSSGGDDESLLVENGKLIQAEKRQMGSIKLSVYRQYFGAAVESNSKSVGLALLLGTVLLFSAGQALRMMSDVWLVFWVEDGSHPTDSDAYVFMGLLGAALLVQLGRVTVLMTVATSSARNMHNSVFRRVVRAPIS